MLKLLRPTWLNADEHGWMDGAKTTLLFGWQSFGARPPSAARIPSGTSRRRRRQRRRRQSKPSCARRTSSGCEGKFRLLRSRIERAQLLSFYIPSFSTQSGLSPFRRRKCCCLPAWPKYQNISRVGVPRHTQKKKSERVLLRNEEDDVLSRFSDIM